MGCVRHTNWTADTLSPYALVQQHASTWLDECPDFLLPTVQQNRAYM